MEKIVLISCGSKKMNKRTKAKDMYQSPLFKHSLEYALKLNPDKIFILSALYGLLDLETEIEPYDVTISNVSKQNRLKKPQLKVLNKMKELTLPHAQVAEVIGELNMIRLTRDSKEINLRPEYPLNQSQINRIAERYLINKHHYEGEGEYNITLYDLYNMGTEVQKPGIMDLPLIIPANHSLGQFFISNYNLN